jgi:hypothetical protein
VSLPAEPQGLLSLTAATPICSVVGRLSDGVALAARPAGKPFATASGGAATLELDAQGSPFLQANLPSGVTIAGFATWTEPADQDAHAGVSVYAKRWLSFGGVYFPGATSKLVVRRAQSGKLLVSPGDEMVSVAGSMAGFELPEAARTIQVACADLSLEPDADGALGREAPEPFQPAGATKPQQMWLASRSGVPVAASISGPPGGTLDASKPAELTVLEQRGARARVRYEHIVGWVDAKALYPSYEKAIAKVPLSQELGMIGLLNSGTVTTQAASSGRILSCSKPVRLVATPAPGERYLVGTIPAARSFRVGDESAELTALQLGGSELLAVPSRDLAASCAAASSEHLAAFPPLKEGGEAPRDAVDLLEAEPDDTDSIGLGNIGSLRRVAPPGSGGLGPPATASPRIRSEALQVSGRLPPEVVTRIVRQSFGRLRVCYEKGLAQNPAMQGRMVVRFVIDNAGEVKGVSNGGSQLANRSVEACILKAFNGLTFPQPEGGIVSVTAPLTFSPPP